MPLSIVTEVTFNAFHVNVDDDPSAIVGGFAVKVMFPPVTVTVA